MVGALKRAAFRRLPLVISARIATGRATVGALRDLGSGDVVPLDTPIGDPSLLVIAGVPVASGEIVEVKGQLALRVTRLGSGE